MADVVARVLGTPVEIIGPLALLFSQNKTITIGPRRESRESTMRGEGRAARRSE